MLATKLQDKKNEEGFTLIELLVVVIIIGILAAIAIPAFLNQRESAWQGSVESDVRNAAIQVETIASRTGGDYPEIADEAFDPDDFSASADVSLYYETITDGYTLCGSHQNLGGESITYNSSAGGLADAEWVEETCEGDRFVGEAPAT